MKKSRYSNIHQPLIDLCRKGDTKAQFEIYKLYSQAMYNTCFRIIGNEYDAEDILQEAFFKAFDRIKTYRNEVSFGAWLKRIVVNASIDQLKKRKIELVSIENAPIHITAEQEGTLNPESVEQLNWALTQLPEGYRTIISLFYFEEFSHEEIAKCLGIKESTSRSQLTRGRKALYDVMTAKRNGGNYG